MTAPKEPFLKRLPPEIAARDDHEILLWVLREATGLSALFAAVLFPPRLGEAAHAPDPYAGVKPEHRALMADMVAAWESGHTVVNLETDAENLSRLLSAGDPLTEPLPDVDPWADD